MSDGPQRRSFTGPRIWGLLLLAAGIAVLVATTTIRSPEGYASSGPRFMPLIVALMLIVLSLVFLARTIVRPDIDLAERAAREDAETDWATPLGVVLALVVYVFLLEPVGYIAATTVFFPIVAYLLGSRSPLRDALIGIGLAVVVFVLFTEFLGVDLPAGLTPIT